MKKVFGKMSDAEIGRRLMKYAVKNNVKDLKYIYYLEDDSDLGDKSDILNNTFRLDQLKHYIDIFNETSTNLEEIENNIKIFDKLVKKHEELYDE